MAGNEKVYANYDLSDEILQILYDGQGYFTEIDYAIHQQCEMIKK
jgi:hypothetical protein